MHCIHDNVLHNRQVEPVISKSPVSHSGCNALVSLVILREEHLPGPLRAHACPNPLLVQRRDGGIVLWKPGHHLSPKKKHQTSRTFTKPPGVWSAHTRDTR